VVGHVEFDHEGGFAGELFEEFHFHRG